MTDTRRSLIEILVIPTACLILMSKVAEGAPPRGVKAYLSAFHADSRRMMNAPLPKKDAHGRVVQTSDTLFSDDDIASGNYVATKDSVRRRMCKIKDRKKFCLDQESPAAISGNDRPEDLVESPFLINTPLQMDSQGLTTGTASFAPWSDSYWPMAKGTLGIRYADPSFPNSWDWAANFSYTQAWPVLGILNSTNISARQNLSPSEKYDSLLGDTEFSLTAYNWNQGRAQYQQTGHVETWMGICEGWSAAALAYAQPTQAVSLQNFSGQSVTFYPSDIRGLASLLWARSAPPVRFVGSRCSVKNPAQDANGRVIDDACFNTNPGTWHIAVVNEIGVLKKPFVMDATYDYEVWNQPVYKYLYTYFNPQTHWESNRAATATIPLTQFTSDKFTTYRSPLAKSIVGVSMDVSYVIETTPNHFMSSGVLLHTVNYMYDLELDESGKIIGGEWYTNQHPDFLWTVPQGTRAVSIADRTLSPNDWNTLGPVPPSWSAASAQASLRGQPLAAVVEKLVSLSHPAK